MDREHNAVTGTKFAQLINELLCRANWIFVQRDDQISFLDARCFRTTIGVDVCHLRR